MAAKKKGKKKSKHPKVYPWEIVDHELIAREVNDSALSHST